MFSNEEAQNEGLADRWLIWRREAIYGCLAGVDLCRPYGSRPLNQRQVMTIAACAAATSDGEIADPHTLLQETAISV